MSAYDDGINICGDGELEADLNLFLKSIVSPAVIKALDEVGADMQDALAQHIETDVYDPYSPKMYERRGSAGGLLEQAQKAKIYNHGNGVSIEYKPDGTHPKVAGWHKVDGDELIGRIEKHSPEYNWLPKRGKIPNRPFWQKFTEEMVDDGMAEHFFASAMRGQKIEITEDGEIFREPADGTY